MIVDMQRQWQSVNYGSDQARKKAQKSLMQVLGVAIKKTSVCRGIYELMSSLYEYVLFDH